MGLATDFAFHERTKHTRVRTVGGIKRGPLPAFTKEYPGEGIPLPQAQVVPGGLPLEEAIQRRRSRRDYLPQPISLEQLARLLFYANGVTGAREAYGLSHFPLRTAPSAGGLSPIELYPVVNAVEGLEPGLYYYQPLKHSLQRLKAGDFRRTVADLCLEQDFLTGAATVVFLSAVYERTRWKYGERAYRYVHLDAGHVSQNLLLEATALGLGACCVGAFFDDDVNAFLGLDGQREFAVLSVAVGVIK